MLSEAQALPEDPAQLREAAEGLVSLVKSQALRIAKLEHQLAGLGYVCGMGRGATLGAPA